MQKLSTIQKRENLNAVYKDGAPGPGGAYHDYAGDIQLFPVFRLIGRVPDVPHDIVEVPNLRDGAHCEKVCGGCDPFRRRGKELHAP